MEELKNILESSLREAIQETLEDANLNTIHTSDEKTDRESFIKKFMKNPKEESLRIFADTLYDVYKESITSQMKRQYLLDVILAYIKK